jgi:hypothetical protein
MEGETMNWLMGHLIGDFLLQSDWMALNKKKRTWPCTVHCLIYAITVVLCARWPWWTLPIIFVTHFAQDRTNVVVWLMNHKDQKQFAQPPMAPWSIIVVDNVMHLTVLWILSFWV